MMTTFASREGPGLPGQVVDRSRETKPMPLSGGVPLLNVPDEALGGAQVEVRHSDFGSGH